MNLWKQLNQSGPIVKQTGNIEPLITLFKLLRSEKISGAPDTEQITTSFLHPISNLLERELYTNEEFVVRELRQSLEKVWQNGYFRLFQTMDTEELAAAAGFSEIIVLQENVLNAYGVSPAAIRRIKIDTPRHILSMSTASLDEIGAIVGTITESLSQEHSKRNEASRPKNSVNNTNLYRS